MKEIGFPGINGNCHGNVTVGETGQHSGHVSLKDLLATELDVIARYAMWC